MIDWFYNTFGTYEDVEEVYQKAEGGDPVRRWVRTYTSDPAWWLFILLFLCATIAMVVWAMIAGGIVALLASFLVSGSIDVGLYNACTIIVREDQKCDRQIFGANRYFRNCPILYIPGWTQLAFFSSKQQTINSPTDPNDPLVVTSWIMQEDPPAGATPEEKRKVPRAEQVVLLKIVFTLAVKNLPKVLSEKYNDAFHRRWLDRKKKDDERYDAMGTDVRAKVLDIVGGNTDGVLQDFTMEQLDADADEANEKLTQRLLPLLRRIGVELEQVIVARVLDMPGTQGFQYNAQKKTQAKQRSDKERYEAEKDRLSRETRASENEAASKAEQAAKANIAKAEAEALVQMIEAEKRRQVLVNQAIIERMNAIADREGQLALSKLSELDPAQITAILNEAMRNINPNLQGATLVNVATPDSVGDFISRLPIVRIFEEIFRLVSGGKPPASPPPAAPST